MKKIIFVTGLILLMTACKKNISELNVDPKNPATAPSYTFFTHAERELCNTVTSANSYLNVSRLIVQHWQETDYPDESQYNLAKKQVNDRVWNALYRNVLRNFEEAKKLIPADVKDTEVQKNQLAMVEIMQIYTYYYLVTTYGNIPYTEALDIENTFPKYDDAATVYADLLSRLDGAISNLNAGTGSFDGADIIYGGDVSKWIKFANSLKLKMGMTIADSDPDKAKSIVESAVTAGVFTSNADNAQLVYQMSPPNTNPIWEDLVQSGRDDFVAASTLVNSMASLADPRIDNYFTALSNGVYSGAEPGFPSAYADFSHVNPKITEPTFPGLLLDYSEVEFLLAEGAERGFNVGGGTAESHYNAAITASIMYWGGTQEEATTYLAQPSVAYATAPGDYKEKIGVQKWIALYNRGWDAWTEWRRLDYPHLEPAKGALSVIPLRYPYPVNEQNVNRANFEQAATAIGGDKVSTKLWWDKF